VTLELLHLCPWCEEEVPERAWAAHQAGRDAARLACPRQDVAAVAAVAAATQAPGAGAYLARGTGLARLGW
jgi:hypothetical protein